VTQQKKAWPESQGPDRYRRGMYIHFWRSSPYPMLPTFDAPEGNTTCTRRTRSNTPLQALTLANDRVFVEIAQALAARILCEPGTDASSRLRRVFQVCLSRTPSPAEEARLAEFIAAQRAFYASAAKPNTPSISIAGITRGDVSPVELAAWTAGARVMLNLDEFITRE